MSALRALIAAMPDIAKALEGFPDGPLKLRAFDALVHAAMNETAAEQHARGIGDTALLPRINEGPGFTQRPA